MQPHQVFGPRFGSIGVNIGGQPAAQSPQIISVVQAQQHSGTVPQYHYQMLQVQQHHHMMMQVQHPAHQQPLPPQDPRMSLQGWIPHHPGAPFPYRVQPVQPFQQQAQYPSHMFTTQQHIPGHWWTDIRQHWKSEDGGDEFWQAVFGDEINDRSLSAGSSSMLASTVGSSSAQAPRPRDYQMLALELQKATKEDLNERVHQLRLTRDLLVKQKDSDAELLSVKIHELENTIRIMNGEHVAAGRKGASLQNSGK